MNHLSHALDVTGLTVRLDRSATSQGATIDNVDIAVASGEMLSIVGPSGSGKTTFLRAVAGLVPVESGRIVIGGAVATDAGRALAPERRHIGLVPQDAALFPHLDVARNVAFGLRGTRAMKKRRVAEMLELVGLGELASRRPHELSGGQRQRVSLARALAPSPPLVLLDEPFSALDASLRGQLRADVRRILNEVGTSAILVTHDQDEALSMADTVAVMRNGRFSRIGTPVEVYERPADEWTARFLGDCALLDAWCDGHAAVTAAGSIPSELPRGRARVFVHPEQIGIFASEHAEATKRATVYAVEYQGHSSIYRLKLDESQESVSARAIGEPHHRKGDHVYVQIANVALVAPVPEE